MGVIHPTKRNFLNYRTVVLCPQFALARLLQDRYDFAQRLERSNRRPSMKRRQVLRATALGLIGAASSSLIPEGASGKTSTAKEFRLDQDASKELASSDWNPIFLDEHQNQTLIALS